MKFNLKNRPKIDELYDSYDNEEVDEWFLGFEEQLRERLKLAKLANPDWEAQFIKEILGDE